MKRRTRLAENAGIAVRSIKSNKLRSALTITIIAVGITSLVGVLTAVDSMDASLRDAYSRLGAGSIRIRSMHSFPPDMHRIINQLEISEAQAEMFARNYDIPSTVTIFSLVADNTSIESGSRKTNPVARIVAVDENYLRYNIYDVAYGRNFSKEDIRGGRSVCIMGAEAAGSLFPDGQALGRTIAAEGYECTVTGVADRTGSTADGGMDWSILVPYTHPLARSGSRTADFAIGILPDCGISPDKAADRAEAVFRSARRLSPADKTDFRITRSETALKEMETSIRDLTVTAVVIGLITILGAAVGLMNIMLVSVKERTGEIGLRKAVGATSVAIRNQFLLEAAVIGESGGIIGIAAGITAGNIIAAVMESAFVIPWLWISAAVLLCLIVSILSGYIPARRAAAMDPVTCLHHD
ncbi:MAG TPA: ABC transporter permease [Candidatus Coprenecus stercoravium]|uniref:ABC transporter permease n=1 Tax=Candidatus Coprenecus stercoravium TaxID=2840735 RepID=A0A9D2GQ03_9BACT|nr:ABC transporter permease [Candidatus Coprenecus stercoravium]